MIIVGSNVSYHIFQKSIARTANPIISVIMTYIIAILASLVILPFFPLQKPIVASFKDLNWASFALGLSIVGVEVGYLLFYRSGWFISYGPIICNLLIVIILIPIGVLLYKENLTISNYIGIVLAAIGLFLILKK
jgi:drug/metabolite transporter (DMT)-like permease